MKVVGSLTAKKGEQMLNVDKTIKKHLTIEFNYVDLFYAYCAGLGYEDPENDIESDERYDELEKEFERKITYEVIRNLGEAIMAEGMERINYAMAELARKEG